MRCWTAMEKEIASPQRLVRNERLRREAHECDDGAEEAALLDKRQSL